MKRRIENKAHMLKYGRAYDFEAVNMMGGR